MQPGKRSTKRRNRPLQSTSQAHKFLNNIIVSFQHLQWSQLIEHLNYFSHRKLLHFFQFASMIFIEHARNRLLGGSCVYLLVENCKLSLIRQPWIGFNHTIYVKHYNWLLRDTIGYLKIITIHFVVWWCFVVVFFSLQIKMSQNEQLTPVQEFYKGKTIFITGASGFMGKVCPCSLFFFS